MRHPVDYAASQDFGDNPTSILPASHWIIKQFGNYQPDGHTGTDYPCPIGTPVRSVADGTVLHAGYYGGTYADNPYWISPGFAGYCYVVDHGAFIGIYGHCRDGGALVHAGQRVTEGRILGPSGNTGASTGPHLHFEALPDGYVLNSFMYGRINPARLFAGITPQGTTTSEEDDMPSANEIAQAILNFNINREGPGASGQINLGAFLAWSDANNRAIIDTTSHNVLNGNVPWYGFSGTQPTEGRTATTLAGQLGWLDTQHVALSNAVAGLTEIVKQLSVKQGVVIDYDKIAKAVNDDQAARMKG